MKIYFSGSIRGGRQDADLYHKIINELKKYGEVLTEHIGSSEISTQKTDIEIHDQDIQWLQEADIVVAEVTTPSLGVGYEIGRAVAMEKEIVCLYREAERSTVSAMLKGSPDVGCYEYSDFKSAQIIIKGIFEK